LFRGEFATWLGIDAANGVDQVELCGVQAAAAANLHLVSRIPRVALEIKRTIDLCRVVIIYIGLEYGELSGFSDNIKDGKSMRGEEGDIGYNFFPRL
jgi:hypothetical protein